MTAQEHLQWAKDRALEYLGPKPSPNPTTMQLVDDARAAMVRSMGNPFDPTEVYAASQSGRNSAPDLNGAYMSFISDMNKHEGTRNHSCLPLGHKMYFGGMLGTEAQMRHWIEGFN